MIFLNSRTSSPAEGFIAAAPDLYHRDPPDCKDDGPTRRMRLRDATVIQDVNATVNFIKSHKSVDPGKIGIVGFCMGGRVVYLMSAVNPDIKAGVMYYGSDPFSPGATARHRSNEPRISPGPIIGHFGEDNKNPSPADMKKLDAS